MPMSAFTARSRSKRASRQVGDVASVRSTTRLSPLLIVLTFVACGQSPREEYLGKADGICSAVNTRIGDELKFRSGGPDGTVGAGDAGVLAERVSAFEGALREIRQLDAPKGDEGLLKPWLEKMDAFVSYIQELHDFFRPADPFESQAGGTDIVGAMIANVHESGAEGAGRTGKRVGLDDCADYRRWQIFAEP
jgi:hypothetical protein